MKKSKLQVKIPRLVKLNYKVNKNYNEEGYIDLEINSRTVIDKGEDFSIVGLELNIFDEESLKEVPFFINIMMEAEFTWDADISDEMLNMLLQMNAPAILLSYMRPYISNITSGSGFPPLILPLLDFSVNENIEYK